MNITLYSTGCSKCNILKTKLASKGIVFEENNDVDQMQALGMLEAPALMVGSELLSFVDAVKWVNEQ